MKVFSDRHPTGLQSFNLYFFAKLTRCHSSQALIEIEKNYAFNTASGDIEHFVADIVDSCQHLMAMWVHFFGVRLKSDCTRNQSTKIGLLYNFGKQSLMTAMNAVKIADRNRTVHPFEILGNASEYFHVYKTKYKRQILTNI